MDFSEEQFHRYARHLILDEVGEEGQKRLLESKVLGVGAGGLGAPALLYLAAAGIGSLGIIDDDEVDLTNLQRQVIHNTKRLGTKKADSAKETIAELNPGIEVNSYNLRLNKKNAANIISFYDVVLDGSDNFETRYLLNDTCYHLNKTLISAALLRFEGQLYTFRQKQNQKTACYRCLFSEAPPPDLVPRCEEAGVLGALAGVMGSLQAVEAIKELLDLGDSMAGRILIFDSLKSGFHTIKVPHNPNCALCGDHPSIQNSPI